MSMMTTTFNPIHPQVMFSTMNPHTWQEPQDETNRVKLTDQIVSRVLFVRSTPVELRRNYGWKLYQISDHTYGDLTHHCRLWLAIDNHGHGTIYIQGYPSRRERIVNLISCVLKGESGLECSMRPISNLRITPMKEPQQ